MATAATLVTSVITGNPQNSSTFNKEAASSILGKINELRNSISTHFNSFDSKLEIFYLSKLYLSYFKTIFHEEESFIDIDQLKENLSEEDLCLLSELLNKANQFLIYFNQHPSFLHDNILIMRVFCDFLSRFSDTTIASLTKNTAFSLKDLKRNTLLNYYHKYYRFFDEAIAQLTVATNHIFNAIKNLNSNKDESVLNDLEIFCLHIKQLIKEVDPTTYKKEKSLYTKELFIRHILIASSLDILQEAKFFFLRSNIDNAIKKICVNKITLTRDFLRNNSPKKSPSTPASIVLNGELVFFQQPKPKPLNDDLAFGCKKFEVN